MSHSEDFQEITGDELYSNGVRTGILIALYTLKKITFTNLLKSTGIPKSSLHVHLKWLSDNGYIIIKKELTIKRPMTFVRITPSGMEKIEKYLNILENIKKINKN